ncbi:PPC domain-containing DNA-binding protein [Candidatus Latescibacterota bacterium]
MSLKRISRRGILTSGAAAVTAATIGTPSVADAAVSEKKGIRTIVSEGLGRIVILSFDRGEKLREGIRDKMAEVGIKNAVIVSAIGTFEKARFHRIKNVNQYPEDEIIEIDDAMELSSVDGIIADGEPHFHMTFQDMDRAYSAHLEDGSIVCYLAEIVLAEIKGVELIRIKNEYGIPLLHEKK